MDKLEDHIRKNREEFDVYTPSSNVWTKVRRKIRKGYSPYTRWLSIAAMVIVILGTSLIIIKQRYYNTYNLSADNNIISSKGNSQLKESEIYYNNLLNSLYTEATPLLTANPEVQKELSYDISHIDSLCLEIKKDLKDNVANKEVVEALIQNYRIKIRLLEDILTILKENETNPEKKKNYEL
ncbi:MAG: hypothetical protein IPH69_10305 [Bacteroidales bacterium]|nr:hypothetical protein [Bacteroidales bacterium]